MSTTVQSSKFDEFFGLGLVSGNNRITRPRGTTNGPALLARREFPTKGTHQLALANFVVTAVPLRLVVLIPRIPPGYESKCNKKNEVEVVPRIFGRVGENTR